MEPDDDNIVRLANSDKRHPRRPKWSRPLEGKIALMTSLWGEVDVISFSHFVTWNGGVAFFIPYLFFLLVVGLPMLLLEVGIGQFMERGTFRVWNMVPLFRGLGYAMTINSATAVWASIHTLSRSVLLGVDIARASPEPLKAAEYCSFSPENYTDASGMSCRTEVQQLMAERWPYEDTPSQIDGAKVMMTVVGLLLAGALSSLGPRVVGKFSVVLLVVTLPTMLMLLVQALLLDGAADGIGYGLAPDFSVLMYFRTWETGCYLALISLTTSFGSLTTIASYNNFQNNFLLDCLLAVALKLVMSIVFAVVMFSIFGFTSKKLGADLRDFIGGESLAVAVESLMYLKGGGFWAVLLMLSICLMNLNLLFWSLETVVVAIHDLLPPTPRFRHLRKKVVLVSVLFIPLLFYGIGYCVQSPRQILIANASIGSVPVIFLTCLLQCMAIGWVYGPRRFQANWESMQGRCSFPYPLVFWTIVTPIALFVMLVWTCTRLDIFWEYDLMSISGMVWILLVVVVTGVVVFATRPGSLRQKWRATIGPFELRDHQLTPRDRLANHGIPMSNIVP